MELESVVPFLENKAILVIGATGFLAKIFAEKVLRTQPNVKKLYLLLRAADSKSAAHRLHDEVIAKDLFRVIKEQWGENLNSFISKKVTPVAGDICFEDLGLKNFNLRDEMLKEIDVIINFAASTNFDERYDVALYLNTFGANHVLNFAKKCAKLKVYIHVSTAYVCGEKEGLILEGPCKMRESNNGVLGLDIEMEKKLMEEKLNDLKANGATEKSITISMKEFGIERAKMYGWPNTYVFTKAMGEMLLRHNRENIPLVILRPAIISSTYKEPFPGWVEGVRTIDSLLVVYGKGKLTCFLCDTETIVDVIPADMVVNSIIVAMAGNANQSRDDVIYQVGSSLQNPVRYRNLQEVGYRYFTKRPWINEDGKPVIVGRVTLLNSMDSFSNYMAIRYLLPLKLLEWMNMALCQYFQHTYMEFNRKIKFVMRLIELYKPYLFFKGVFDDINTEKLRMALRANSVDNKMFYFDPKSIDWDDYFMNTHIPGIVTYIFK